MLAVCLALAGLLAGMETGIYVLNRIRLDLRSEAGGADARKLRAMLDRPEHLLAVLLVGNNLAVYWATFAVSAMLVLAGHREHVELYALAVTAPLLLVAGRERAQERLPAPGRDADLPHGPACWPPWALS